MFLEFKGLLALIFGEKPIAQCDTRLTPSACSTVFLHRRYSLLVLLASVVVWASGCSAAKSVSAGPTEVEVVGVVQKDVPITRQWVATLTGKINVQIRAQVPGRLVKQLYSNGAFVTKGTPLFQLDSRTFQASLDQAKGVLQQAQDDLTHAQAQQVKTQLDVNRYTARAQTGTISRQELDEAVRNNLSALAQVEAAKAAVASAQASLETARLNLGYSTIIAPTDGVAGIATAQVGDFISPQSPGALTTISTINPILANITLREHEYPHDIREVQKSGETEERAWGKLQWDLILTDGSVYPQKGKFYALDRQVDLSAGAILVQIEFPNPTRLLRPGGFGNARTVVNTAKGALVLPQRAVTDVQGKHLVAVVGGNNKVSIRPVTVGDPFGTDWIIQEGLKPGERVVAEGTQKVSEGAVVNPKPYNPQANAETNPNGSAAH